ncbi:MAG: RNA-guided endonuclease TnpB family protein [Rhodospirillaceae bacterium]
MKTLKAYRYRVYPTTEQENLFRQTVGCCRLVYNLALEQRKLNWHRSKPLRLTSYDQIKELPALKDEVPFLRDVPNHPLQQAIVDLDKAFKNFFEGRAAYPQFRKRGDRDSFRYPDPKQFKITTDRIFLPKAGWVDWVQHRPVQGTPKTVTVSRTADAWFVSVQCEVEVATPLPVTGAAVGIDLGVAKPMALSTGEIIMLPRTTETERRRLGALQQRVSRRTKGSRNRRKAQMAVARFQARLARRRKDAAHKATTRIAKSHGIIVVEDLKVRNMTASAAGTVEEPGRNVRAKAGLNRSMLDVAPSQIRQMLEYKAGWYGSTVVAVPPAYTSQRCSHCGFVHPDNRITQAEFACRSCGYTENADVNAARNILQLGTAQAVNVPSGRSTGGLPGLACESNRTSGRKQEKKRRKA